MNHSLFQKKQQTTLISILADYRESKSGVIEALKANENVDVTIETLPLGDYEINNQLLFERKTLRDFATSIKDGRLFRQATRLVSSSKRCALILEGTARDLTGTNMRREAIQGALISLSMVLGIPILRALNPQESAKLMIYAANQFMAIANGALPRHGVRPKGKHRTQIHILQGLPGVGPDRAKKLLESFGSIEAVLSASIEDLLGVPGVGKRTAEAIRWAVGDKPGEYGLSENCLFDEI